jgi:hypothetical protein
MSYIKEHLTEDSSYIKEHLTKESRGGVITSCAKIQWCFKRAWKGNDIYKKRTHLNQNVSTIAPTIIPQNADT